MGSIRFAVGVGLALPWLVACGQKGPLTLPPSAAPVAAPVGPASAPAATPPNPAVPR